MISFKSSYLDFWQRKRLPVILQAEAAECGLASLCMIATYWGHVIDLSSIRRRFSISLKGASLKSLIVMAEAMNLQTRALKLDMEDLDKLRLPCIIHWNLHHFVVLKKVSNSYAIIHDPSVGLRRITISDFSKHFTGVALELVPAPQFEKQKETSNFSIFSLMGRVVGLKRGLSQLLVLGLALQVCALAAPFYMQWLVDEALIAGDRDLITVLGLGFTLLVLIQTVVGAIRSWLTTVLATDLNQQWLSNAFSHLMRLPLPYFEKRHTGDIVSRFGSIQSIQHALTTQLVEGIIDGVLVIGTLAMMLLYSVPLTVLAVVTVLFYVLLRLILYRPMRAATAEQIIHSAKQQSHFMESVRGIQSIRLFVRSDERRLGWLGVLTDQLNAEIRISRLTISYQTTNALLFNTERILVVWLAALAVVDGKFSIGMLLAFMSYKDQFSQRLSNLVDKVFELKMLRLHGERLADILTTEAEKDSFDQEQTEYNSAPSIELINLCFRYADSEPFIIKNLNLVIPGGQYIAITGASGCGKTTLVKILLGLLEPSEGKILIDGKEMSKVGKKNYRSLVGTVMQEDVLFAGSIADNIHFFDPSPNQARSEFCATLAAIHNDIISMPMGYQTLIGDIGTGLSGGQRQRLLLARALYKDPKILVLDEATSHLDSANEQQVNFAIRNIPLTRFIVAHRSETIAIAHRVIMMKDGCIVRDILQKNEIVEVPIAA